MRFAITILIAFLLWNPLPSLAGQNDWLVGKWEMASLRDRRSA